MPASAGRLISLKVSGVATLFTGEATTSTGHLTYQITNAAKRVWDRAAAITVKDGGVVTGEAFTLNRLAGTVTFGTVNAARVITIDGSYLPLSTLAEAHQVDLSCSATYSDETVFGMTDTLLVQQLERDCSGTITRFKSIDTYLVAAYDAAVPIVIEYSPDGGTTPHFRAWALLNKNAFQGSPKTLIDESVAFDGAADVSGRSHTWLTTIVI